MPGHNFLFDWVGAPWVLEDPGTGNAISVARTAIVPIVTAAASETNTLPDPDGAGTMLFIYHKTDGGDRAVTADTAFDEAGNTIFTFNEANEAVLLLAVPGATASSYRWHLVSNNGADLS